MSFTLYQKYESSGVEWLEKLPSHWYVKKLKQACLVFPSNVDKKSYEDEESVYLCNYTDVYYSEKIVAGMDFMKATASKEQVDKFTLKAGDTIITKDSETADDIGISAFVPDDIPGVICGYHLSIIRPKIDTDGKFIKYFFSSHFAKSKLAVAATGLTRVGLSQYAIDNLQLPYPLTTEQIAIANFLDCETTKIDALIAEQEKLMNLLREKRQSVISHAVTKGLDPKVTMKDSGIKWLGEVPEHWELKKIKWCAKLKNEKTSDRSNTIALENIESWTGRFIDTESEFEGDGVKFYEGDVLFGKLRPYLAKVFRATMSGEAIGDFFVLEPNQNLLSQFAERLFISSEFIDAINSSTYGTKMPRVNWEYFSSMSIPLPPKHEQIQISNYLVTAIEEMDELIATSINAVDLLEERRSALISAAVTGQIDVRNYQPKEAV